MSEQDLPGTPAEGPDPFAELLKGLIEEPTAEQPAAAAGPAEPTPPAAAPTPEPPVTSSADVPTVAFTPFEQPTVVPAGVEQSPTAAAPIDEPTVAFSPEPVDALPEPTAVFPEPIPASGTPSAGLPPTIVLPGTLDPTAATTVLAGGSGGGLPPSEPPKGGGFRSWEPRRKALFIILISAAGLLLIALVILLIVLLGGNKGNEPTPAPSPTGTSTATSTPTPTVKPTPTPTPTVKPAVQAFTVNSNTAVCADTGAGTNVTMHFAWTVVGNPTQIAIASAPNAIDAIANPFQNNLPPTATDFQMPFGCNNAQLTYSLTIAGPDGQHYSGIVTVARQYTPPPPTPDGKVTNFSADVSADNFLALCTADPASTVDVKFSWTTSNATEVSLSLDTSPGKNAFDEPWSPPYDVNGSQTISLSCGDDTAIMVSARSATGVVDSKTLNYIVP